MNDITILGIETSCDETAAAVVKNGREIVSESLYSQIDLHKVYGGVVPEIASRSHVEKLPVVVEQAVEGAGGLEAIDAVAVTNGPGLVGALLTGVSYAKGIAFVLKKPLIAVQHIAGHICANLITHSDLEPPFLCLVVSGGHTEIVNVIDYDHFEVLGSTRDDAAGEAIDKAARALGLPYPGGPNLQELAKKGDAYKYSFPKSFRGQTHLDFSFSGIKTAVINLLHRMDQAGESYNKEDVAASFLRTVAETLLKNTFVAAERTAADKIAVVGGVSANEQIRAAFRKKAEKEGVKLYFPELKYCTDNAVMIASRAYYDYIAGNFADMRLNAQPIRGFGE